MLSWASNGNVGHEQHLGQTVSWVGSEAAGVLIVNRLRYFLFVSQLYCPRWHNTRRYQPG